MRRLVAAGERSKTVHLYMTRGMGEMLAGRQLNPRPWQDVDVPVLVVDGGKSHAAVRVAADALAEHLPHGSRLTLPGQSHNVAIPALAGAIGDFAKLKETR